MRFSSGFITPLTTLAGTLVFMGGSVYAQTTTGPLRDGGYYHGPGMMWGGGSMGGFGMFFGFFFMLLVLAVIVGVVVLIMRSLNLTGTQGSGASSSQGGNAALDILKERFAKGEIDAKEFDERKRLLAD